MNNIKERIHDELYKIGLNADEATISACVRQTECELQSAIVYGAVAEYFFAKGDLEWLKIWQNKYKKEFERVTQIKLSKSKKKTKFLFVEDGTIDLEKVEQSLAVTNPEIKVVVYRQGGSVPQLIELFEI